MTTSDPNASVSRISNRSSLRLESSLSHTKQTVEVVSDRRFSVTPPRHNAPGAAQKDIRYFFACGRMGGMTRPRFKIMHYRLRILRFTDAEIIRAGKEASPAASFCMDQATQEENALKYDALQQEWRRRHPRKKT